MQPDLGWTKSPIATHHMPITHTHIIRTFLTSDRTAALSEMSGPLDAGSDRTWS